MFRVKSVEREKQCANCVIWKKCTDLSYYSSETHRFEAQDVWIQKRREWEGVGSGM